jgi:hypothetical protein
VEEGITGHGAAQPSAAASFEHLPFEPHRLASAPAATGVYLLYRGHRLIYIGLAHAGRTIRACLEQHRRGAHGPCTAGATEFDYEVSRDPVWLYRHYLAVYLDATRGLLPDCNRAGDR